MQMASEQWKMKGMGCVEEMEERHWSLEGGRVQQVHRVGIDGYGGEWAWWTRAVCGGRRSVGCAHENISVEEMEWSECWWKGFQRDIGLVMELLTLVKGYSLVKDQLTGETLTDS